ncbi:unnamed protein product [Soboliphyme baturini]|uniref:ascorbate ferrireductase (transmembrane) n=1 Tax=Soboliphyme baturini TaxID=241478 RepID=A0A183IGJ3_9BILA|nr:unnamed protein product [Soboliphyme baturini]
MSFAILSLTQYGVMQSRVSWLTRVNLHGWLLAAASLLSVCGFIVVYTGKTAFGKNHFTTYHGLIGFVTVCFTLLQLPTGLLLKYAYALQLTTFVRLVDMKFAHSLSGSLLYVFGCVALMLSFVSNWFVHHTSTLTVYYSFAIVAMMATFFIGNAYSIIKVRL